MIWTKKAFYQMHMINNKKHKILTENIIEIIKKIPYGKVTTYGKIALYAGDHKASLQVARILHSSSKKYNLPWYRIINKNGRISLPIGGGYELQKSLLIKEGINFSIDDKIDFNKFLWNP